jgi:hypothetical protein
MSVPPIRSDRHIFIAFKTEERDHALRLHTALKSQGFNVWWQENLQCGHEWHGEIDRALATAGCVVVLWSNRSLQSPWVRHEASEALALGVYAPARLEPLEIVSPYDRIQATDLMNWDGNPNQPGFQNLLRRVDELMPPPETRWQRASGFAKRSKALLLATALGLSAFVLLLRLGVQLDSQIQKQAQNNERQAQMFEQQLELAKGQTENNAKQSQIFDKQTAILDGQALNNAQQTRINNDLNRSLQPLKDVQITAYVEVDPETPGVSEYVRSLKASVDPSHVPPGVYVSELRGSSPTAIKLVPQSDLWPKKDDPSLLYWVLSYVELSLQFRLDPHPSKGPADLAWTAESALGGTNGQPGISWQLESDKIGMSFSSTPEPFNMQLTPKIVSVPDLERSTLQATFKSVMVPNTTDEKLINETLKARAGLRLKTLFIDYSGRKIMIRDSNMHESVNERGLRVYTVLVSKGEKLSF